MDFISGLSLPKKKHNVVWVVIDRLTKLAHFIPFRIGTKMGEMAKLYKEFAGSKSSESCGKSADKKTSNMLANDDMDKKKKSPLVAGDLGNLSHQIFAKNPFLGVFLCSELFGLCDFPKF